MKQRPRIYYSSEQKNLMWDHWQAQSTKKVQYDRRRQQQHEHFGQDLIFHEGVVRQSTHIQQ